MVLQAKRYVQIFKLNHMKIILRLLAVVLLLSSCKEEREEEVNNNFFIYQGTKHYTPFAYYGIENDGIELNISSFNYNPSTGEYSGSGNGVDFIKLKSMVPGKFPIGTFQSYVNWGDTASRFLGIALMNVDALYSGNYKEWDLKSGSVTISEGPKGYIITYEVFIEDSVLIKGQYEGNVIKN